MVQQSGEKTAKTYSGLDKSAWSCPYRGLKAYILATNIDVSGPCEPAGGGAVREADPIGRPLADLASRASDSHNDHETRA